MVELSKFIADKLALYFPKDRYSDLERNISTAAKEFGYNNLDEFVSYVLSTPLNKENIEVLAANLTINETYFWREPQTFEALEQMIIPELIRRRQKKEKKIRIWSAGCSTGEEPYSIAIALSRLIPNIENWDISILATDINQRVLEKAKKGIYGKWSFRGTPTWLKEKYFISKPNDKFEIIPKIKHFVKFEYLNLAEKTFPSSLNNTNAMDLIYCRNVLMYFTPDRFKQVAKGLYNSLQQGGYLIVSASELSLQNFPDFVPVNFQGMVLYQKNSGKIKHQYKYDLPEVSEPVIFPIASMPEPISENIKTLFGESGSMIQPSAKIPTPVVSIYEESLKSYSQGQYSEVTKKLQKDNQTLEEQLLLIQAFSNQGKLNEALMACEKAIASNKSNPRLYYLEATILRENNQLDEAITCLKRAIYLDSDFVLSYYSLGNIYKQLGNIKNARKQYEIALMILNKCSHEDVLTESGGITAGRFKEIINASL